MIITCYRYDSGFRNVTDTVSLIPPATTSSDHICEEIRLVLPTDYTLSETVSGECKIFDENGCVCDLCPSNNNGNAILAVSATRMIGMKRVPEGKTLIPLQEARLASGLTQQQLADASGVNIRQIQRIELEESEAGNMTANNLLAIADVLSVDPHTLL